jgi:hypothetical protein
VVLSIYSIILYLPVISIIVLSRNTQTWEQEFQHNFRRCENIVAMIRSDKSKQRLSRFENYTPKITHIERFQMDIVRYLRIPSFEYHHLW